MSTQKTGQIMKNLFVNVLIVLLFTCIALPHSEAASASFSGSMSVSVTPSFSSSLSGSYSATQSYSQSSALTQTASYSISLTRSYLSLSGVPTFTATVGTLVPPPAGYTFTNHCPYQSTAVCPFWSPNAFPSYRLTIMDTSGTMLTFDNIVIPPGEVPQFPVSFDSTNGFIKPGSTYRFELFGCTSPGQCVEYWTPLVVTTNPRTKPVCNPNYVCRAHCFLAAGAVECVWQNPVPLLTPYKRAILRIIQCLQLPSLTVVTPNPMRIASHRHPKPQDNFNNFNLTLPVPPGCVCEVDLIIRYHPLPHHQVDFKYYFFT